MRRILGAFLLCRSATAAILFVVMLPVVLVAIGAAIDYSRAIALRQSLQAAADSAALAVLASNTPQDQLQSYGLQVFLENLAADDRSALLGTPSVIVSRVEAENVSRSRFEFEAEVATLVAPAFGVKAIPVTGSSTAENGLQKYVDIHVLLDTSDSMGLGSSLKDRDALRLATANLKIKLQAENAAAGKSTDNVLYGDNEDKPKYSAYFVASNGTAGFVGCEFACHKPSGPTTVSTLKVARDEGIELRIDTAKTGIDRVAQLAQDLEESRTSVRMGLSVFSSGYRTVLPISANLTAFRNKLENDPTITIGAEAKLSKSDQEEAEKFYGFWNKCWNNSANTFFDYNVHKVAADLEQSKKTAANSNSDKRLPTQVVLIVTDGLKSQNCAASTITKQTTSDGAQISGKENVFPFRASDCEVMKKTGALVAVIYTEYTVEPLATYLSHARHAVEETPPPAQAYKYLDKTKSSGIERNLRSCATPGLFAKGADPAEINRAFESIFRNLTSIMRLTT